VTLQSRLLRERNDKTHLVARPPLGEAQGQLDHGADLLLGRTMSLELPSAITAS